VRRKGEISQERGAERREDEVVWRKKKTKRKERFYHFLMEGRVKKRESITSVKVEERVGEGEKGEKE